MLGLFPSVLVGLCYRGMLKLLILNGFLIWVIAGSSLHTVKKQTLDKMNLPSHPINTTIQQSIQKKHQFDKPTLFSSNLP